MPKSTNNDNKNTTTGSGDGDGGKTFTQADLDRIVADRIDRERKKFADYDELKAAAENANKDKSEIEKLNDTVNKLSTDLESSKADTLRADVAADKGVPKTLLSGKTREELEAAADALLEFRGEKPAGNDKGKGGGEQTPWGGKSNDDGKTNLRDGTVPSAGGSEQSGEDLAKQVWERAHGGV